MAGDTVTTREAAAADAPAIQRVARASWEGAYEGILAEAVTEAMLEGGYSATALETLAADPDTGLFVAEADDEVVGYANGEPVGGGDGEVSVYVDPDYWGEGVGSALLARAVDHLDELGVERVSDEVLAENEVGNAFYASHFAKTGEEMVEIAGETHRANVYGGPVDAVSP